MLNRYLIQDERQIELEEISLLNSVLKTWISAGSANGRRRCFHHYHSEASDHKCLVVYKFFTVYGIQCNKPSEKGKQKLETVSSSFISWVRRFIQKNGIFFPHIDTLFLRLVFCMIPIAGHMLEQSDKNADEDSAEYVGKLRLLLGDAIKSCESGSIKAYDETASKEHEHCG